MPKWILRSWTFVTNAVLVVVGAAPVVADLLTQLAGLPELSDQSRYLLLAAGLLNIALRLKTSSAVTVRPPRPEVAP